MQTMEVGRFTFTRVLPESSTAQWWEIRQHSLGVGLRWMGVRPWRLLIAPLPEIALRRARRFRSRDRMDRSPRWQFPTLFLHVGPQTPVASIIHRVRSRA